MNNVSLFFTDSSRSVMSVPCERGVCVYRVKCASFADTERTAVAPSVVESCFQRFYKEVIYLRATNTTKDKRPETLPPF